MSNTIDTTSTIIFNNVDKPEVYTNVENKLLCPEKAEKLLLNCVQIDWQDVHLSNIGRITELSDFVDDPNNFNINTTEELLWVIDQLVAKAYGSLGTITLSFNSSSHAYSGTVWKPTATVSATGSSVTPVSGTHYTLTWSNSSSTNVGTYSCTVTLTETGKRYFSNITVTKNYTITKRDVNVKLSNPTQNVSSSSEINTTTTSTGLVSGHTLSGVTVDISQSPTDSNVYILTPNVQNAVIKKSSTVVTSNYNISVQTGTATVQSQTQILYYWYVGQTDPSSLTEIPQNDIVSDTSSAGWREIGETIGTYTLTNPLWDGALNKITTGATKAITYVALPNSTLKMRNGDGNELDAWINKGTREINGVTYTIYQSPGNMKIFNNIIF